MIFLKIILDISLFYFVFLSYKISRIDRISRISNPVAGKENVMDMCGREPICLPNLLFDATRSLVFGNDP